MITLQNISLRYGEKVIFDDINWLISPGSRIGLVGNNGVGKTTLFKAVLGQVLLDKGSVLLQKKTSVGYLPQEYKDLENVNILDFLKKRCGVSGLEEKINSHTELLSDAFGREQTLALHEYQKTLTSFELKGGYGFEVQAKKVLKGLAFKETDFAKNCLDFSDGWKMRINLAAVLLASPDIMLLDEPTNFLDTESLEWLEEFLKNYGGTLIIIVHDRMFLDHITTHIAELARGKINLYKGNYSYYEQESLRRKEALLLQAERLDKEKERVNVFIDRFRAKATKASQVQSRIKALEKMETIHLEKDAKKIKIKFPQSGKSSREVVEANTISKQYGDLHVFSGISLSVERGEKIALVGVNGAGKSTLLRIISGAEQPTSGKVVFGQNIKLAFFSQEAALVQNSDISIWEEVNLVESTCLPQERRNLLGAFLFSGDDVYKKVSVLSGGEKSRLALLKLLLRESNFLILDEPTNHLDLATKEIFQEALLGYAETLLIVSHDRYFLDNLVKRVLEIRQGRIQNYLGNYSYFIEKRAADSGVAVTEKNVPSEPSAYIVKKQEQREKRQLEKKIKNKEQEIADLEERQAQVQLALSDPDVYKEPARAKELSQEFNAIPAKLEILYNEWHELANKMELASE
jgi:ATP-binding cassette subfamily F protein 3